MYEVGLLLDSGEVWWVQSAEHPPPPWSANLPIFSYVCLEMM